MGILSTPVTATYDADGFDENGFNADGIHRDSAELCDVDGFDAGSVMINKSEEGYFSMSRKVARKSYFKLMVASSIIEKAGFTKIGRLLIKNNTRDGYQVAAISSNGGALSSVTDADGEEDIPYSLHFSVQGSIGEGIDRELTLSSQRLASLATILSKAGNSVSSPTDVSLIATVYIADDSRVLSMSGTYADTLTIEYTDL